ncbi:MAG TPA: biotin--[acetyl-CoA-carboxylase] ligase [Candidatus Caccomorpha excrementavium]|nr:biotin--[acetyl-CoA-carboxylase] ligase [Candidatus Caccomorpha excrementavium]
MVIDKCREKSRYNTILLEQCLKKEGVSAPVMLYGELASTNLTAKEAAKQGAVHCTAVLADSQNSGRGRLGRSFFSPPGRGIYLSAVLRIPTDETSLLRLTTAVCTAVCLAVERVCGLRADIKWVNDVYLRGRKVCGILCEGVLGTDQAISSVIAGIGINYTAGPDDFPPELREKAGALYMESRDSAQSIPFASREALAAALLREVLFQAEHLSDGAYLEEYKKRSLLPGRKIYFTDPQTGNIPASAIGIDDLGGLIVRLEDGTVKALHSGEVTVRFEFNEEKR